MKTLMHMDFGLETDPFPFLNGQPVQFEGLDFTSEFRFRVYNPGEKVGGSPMHKLMPMAMAYWHTMCNPLDDMFGDGAAIRPWDEGKTGMERAETRMRVAFYFMWMQGLEYWCFHDMDIVPYGANITEFERNIDAIVPLIQELQKLTGIKCGWVTQNLFTHPMYARGAATGIDPDVWCHALAQTAKMIDVGKEIGALNHVFWGGREGYNDLRVTDLALEQANLAKFLHQAVEYRKSVDSTAQFLIEPKPKEPTRHQYDTNVATVSDFLRTHGLLQYFKANVEVNHAQLDASTVGHELEVAGMKNLLGGIDANQGTFGNDWDTDEFLNDPLIATEIMMAVLNFGLGSGVINWDAKVRRESCDPADLFRAHTSGIDALATGLRTAHLLEEEESIVSMKNNRYSGYLSSTGRKIASGHMTAEEARTIAQSRQPTPASGRLESVKTIVNNALLRSCRDIGSAHIEPDWRK